MPAKEPEAQVEDPRSTTMALDPKAKRFSARHDSNAPTHSAHAAGLDGAGAVISTSQAAAGLAVCPCTHTHWAHATPKLKALSNIPCGQYHTGRICTMYTAGARKERGEREGGGILSGIRV